MVRPESTSKDWGDGVKDNLQFFLKRPERFYLIRAGGLPCSGTLQRPRWSCSKGTADQSYNPQRKIKQNKLLCPASLEESHTAKDFMHGRNPEFKFDILPKLHTDRRPTDSSKHRIKIQKNSMMFWSLGKKKKKMIKVWHQMPDQRTGTGRGSTSTFQVELRAKVFKSSLARVFINFVCFLRMPLWIQWARNPSKA